MSADVSHGNDSTHIRALPSLPVEYVNHKNWRVEWKVEKWHRSEDHALGLMPDEVVSVCENLLVSGGINLLLHRLIGDSDVTYPPFSNANANLRVGDSSTAATSGDADLNASSNKLSVGMDGGFPTITANQVTFQATFGTGDANFAWNEVGAVNGSGTPTATGTTRLLNHKVQNFGTKASGSTWTLTLNILIT
jgi:hypothetical protein